MLKRHETNLAYYEGARDAFIEYQKFGQKMIEKIAVYEAEVMDDMAAAFEANEASKGEDIGQAATDGDN